MSETRHRDTGFHTAKPRAEAANNVYFRFQLIDATTGLPYTVTISQEGISQKHSEAPESTTYERHYRARVNEALDVELVPEALPQTETLPPPVPPRSEATPSAHAARPAVQGRHDLRHLLNR